jgi:ABC-type transporter Mla subunit MlaD
MGTIVKIDRDEILGLGHQITKTVGALLDHAHDPISQHTTELNNLLDTVNKLADTLSAADRETAAYDIAEAISDAEAKRRDREATAFAERFVDSVLIAAGSKRRPG